MSTKATLKVEGKKVDVTNLDKVFYPESGFTKGDVLDYYIRVSKVLLPHLKGRPISLKRYPDGVDGFFFYEKRCPDHRPRWMKTVSVEKKDGSELHYCTMNSLPALVWAVNLADLELHTFLHKAPAMERPTAMAFDLDPGEPAGLLECCQVALWIKTIFQAAGLSCFPKTSGSKGLQVYVPLNSPTTYDKTKEFAHRLACFLEEHFPELVVSEMKKTLRKGKVFVDWSQNDSKKTTVNVYSLRAKSQPTVSTPLEWQEIEEAVENKEVLSFTTNAVLQRVEKFGDLFQPVLTWKQKLPSVNLFDSVRL